MDAIEKIVLKILLAFIGGIMAVYILSPAIQMFGLVTWEGGDPVIKVLALTVLPIAVAFIGIYKIIGVFLN